MLFSSCISHGIPRAGLTAVQTVGLFGPQALEDSAPANFRWVSEVLVTTPVLALLGISWRARLCSEHLYAKQQPLMGVGE